MKIKKYVITSIIWLIWVAILGFILFKYTAKATQLTQLVPYQFSKIIEIKPNKYFIEKISKLSKTKQQILALSWVSQIILWQYETWNNIYSLSFIKPSSEIYLNNLSLSDFLSKLWFRTWENYKIIKKKGLLIYWDKQSINYWENYNWKNIWNNNDLKKYFEKNHQFLVIWNLENIYSSALKSQLEAVNFKNILANIKYWIVYSEFKKDKTEINFQILLNKPFKLQEVSINPKIFSLFEWSDYIFVWIWDIFKLLNINKKEFALTLKALWDNQVWPIFSSLYSNKDFENLINWLNTWGVKVWSGDNPLNIGISLIFSWDQVYNFLFKSFPYLTEWAKNYGSWQIKIINNENKFGISTILPYKNSFIKTDFIAEYQSWWTFIKILNPIINISKNKTIQDWKWILDFYINLGRILDLMNNKLWIINPYLDIESENYLEKLKIYGNLTIKKQKINLQIQILENKTFNN
jgi:hypothetical protein